MALPHPFAYQLLTLIFFFILLIFFSSSNFLSYKDMPEKPCVLDEVEKDPEALVHQRSRSNFCSPKDIVFLEDEYGRIVLNFSESGHDADMKMNDNNSPENQSESINQNTNTTGKTGNSARNIHIPCVSTFVSGIVAAFLGHLTQDGVFAVTRVFYPGTKVESETKELLVPSPQPQSQQLQLQPLSQIVANEHQDEYIAFASGLELGKTNPMAISFLLDYITGMIGSGADQKRISRISRFILLGNTAFNPPKPIDYSERKKGTGLSAQTLYDLDSCLTQVAQSVHTTIVPGESDPTTFLWPQRPIHPCVLPRASALNSLWCTSNPAWIPHISADDKHSTRCDILATDGRNVSDVKRFSALTGLEVMEMMMKWRIIAPTAPDTIGAFPFIDKDPFVIDNVPDIYAVGMQTSFEFRILEDEKEKKDVLFLAVPSFAATGVVVLVNPRTKYVMSVSLPTFVEAGPDGSDGMSHVI